MLAGFYLVQRRGGQRILHVIIGRLTGDRQWRVLGTIDAVYQNLAAIYAVRSDLVASTVVHMAGWIIGVAEVLIVFACMGHPVSVAEAVVIESLLHAIRGAAFAIPGALGAQEGGLVLLCAAFGIPPEQAIALSLVKRAADLVLGVPGLLGWQRLEWRRLVPSYSLGVAAAARVRQSRRARPLNHDAVLVIGHGIAGRRCRLWLPGRRHDSGRPRGSQPAHARAASAPAVTILKPLHGDEPGLLDNLDSFCRQDYPGPIQVVFGVQDPDDGAIAVVGHLRKAQTTRDLDLVIETKVHGLNRKVSNLVNMAPCIRHDVVVLADSDMRVDPDYLSRVVAALEAPGVGAVTCLYYGVPVAGPWSSLAALAINAHFLPGVVVGLSVGLARPCFGSTLALRRQTLGEIGGFIAFVDCLADDYAMGEALRARGHARSRYRPSPSPICAQRHRRASSGGTS